MKRTVLRTRPGESTTWYLIPLWSSIRTRIEHVVGWVDWVLRLTVLIKQHLGPCWVGCRDEGLIDVGHEDMM